MLKTFPQYFSNVISTILLNLHYSKCINKAIKFIFKLVLIIIEHFVLLLNTFIYLFLNGKHFSTIIFIRL